MLIRALDNKPAAQQHFHYEMLSQDQGTQPRKSFLHVINNIRNFITSPSALSSTPAPAPVMSYPAAASTYSSPPAPTAWAPPPPPSSVGTVGPSVSEAQAPMAVDFLSHLRRDDTTQPSAPNPGLYKGLNNRYPSALVNSPQEFVRGVMDELAYIGDNASSSSADRGFNRTSRDTNRQGPPRRGQSNGKCSYCSKLNHFWAQCRQLDQDRAKGTLRSGWKDNAGSRQGSPRDRPRTGNDRSRSRDGTFVNHPRTVRLDP